jgi:outer membrane immunogenic protein
MECKTEVQSIINNMGPIMRKSSLAGAATLSLIGVSCSCFAADLSRPVYSMPAAPPTPFYSWTGFYVGANVGGAWASGTLSGNFTTPAPPAPSAPTAPPAKGTATAAPYDPTLSMSASNSGVIGGGQLGYNWQIGAFVLGGEWDFDWPSLNASGSIGNLTATVNTNWVDILAARFGLAADNWLWYGKAGGGWAHNRATLTNVVTGAQLSQSNTNSGWLLGAGVEYAFAPPWTVKLEYDYLGLNRWTLNSTMSALNADGLSVKRQINMLTVGLNYKF